MNQTPAQSNPFLTLPDGRTAGALVGEDLVKCVKGSRHMLKSPRGWAIDARMLEDARARGASGIRIEDQETGRVYRADLATVDAHGWTFDRGHGRQIALPLQYWQIEGQPVQGALFAA